MEARLYVVRTSLDYVLVFRHAPTKGRDGKWQTRGQIHPFSPSDADLFNLLPALEVDVPRQCVLSTARTWGRGYFQRETDRVWLVACQRRHWWHRPHRQPFCFTFLTAAGVPDLPLGVPLFWTFA